MSCGLTERSHSNVQSYAQSAGHRSGIPYESLDSKKFHEAAERTLDHYLIPPQIMASSYQTSSMFMVNPKIDTESLLGIAQVVMLGELAVNQALDNVEPLG